MAEPFSGGASVEQGGASVEQGVASVEQGGACVADEQGAPLTKFDRDTAVWRTLTGTLPSGGQAGEDGATLAAHDRSETPRPDSQVGQSTVFAAEVAPDWRAGRGPHGGYLAAMLLRALIESVADETRAPRSLTIHYARAPEPGPVQISTVIERQGRSLSTLSARMHQGEELIALVLGAFSVPWGGPEISDVQMPNVEPADASREGVKLIEHGGPEFARHIVLQPRMDGTVFAGAASSPDGEGEQPMRIRAWIGLAEPRPIDAISLAFFSDALIPAPYMRMSEPVAVPTVDLTVHFRARMRPQAEADPRELCLAQTTTELIHDGFFVEDGTIWATDGTVLAHSRQLAIVIPFHPSR